MISARMFRWSTFVALVALSVAIAGCSDSPTSPSNGALFSQTDLRVGTGSDAINGRALTVNYTGWLYNASEPEQKGAQIDSSVGGPRFSFTLGAGEVLTGWDRGLVGMKIGGLRRLVIPPSLAYGGVRNGLIPANATLVFEIELLSVQ